MIGQLPTQLTIGGIEYEIVTDFRAVLECFQMFMDDSLEAEDEEVELYEKWLCCIYLMLSKYDSIDQVEDDLQRGILPLNEAAEKLKWFFNGGGEEECRERPPVYDWENDEQLIFSAVNDVARMETRLCPYIHWWTFLGYFNQIGEGLFATVINIRNKMNKGKKLEKYEREFVNEHSNMFRRRDRVSKEKQNVLDKLNSGEMWNE